MLVLVIVPVQSAPGIRAGNPDGASGELFPPGMLDYFEETGYDMTAIRAAIESGDKDTARTLLEQFMAEHRSDFPPPPGEEARLSARLDVLEADGIDVSAPRTALESGDLNAVLALLQQLLDKNRDALPSTPRETRFLAQIDRLEALGYDMTAIKAAVENGDIETARALLEQFMSEHRDELPAPRPGTGRLPDLADQTDAFCRIAGESPGVRGNASIDASRTKHQPFAGESGTGYTRFPGMGAKPWRGIPVQTTE